MRVCMCMYIIQIFFMYKDDIIYIIRTHIFIFAYIHTYVYVVYRSFIFIKSTKHIMYGLVFDYPLDVSLKKTTNIYHAIIHTPQPIFILRFHIHNLKIF